MTKSTNTHGSSNETPVKVGVTHRKVTPDKKRNGLGLPKAYSKFKYKVFCRACYFNKKKVKVYKAKKDEDGLYKSDHHLTHIFDNPTCRKYYHDNKGFGINYSFSLIEYCPVGYREEKVADQLKWKERVCKVKQEEEEWRRKEEEKQEAQRRRFVKRRVWDPHASIPKDSHLWKVMTGQIE